MRLDEIYNPQDRLLAKLKRIQLTFVEDFKEVDEYCKFMGYSINSLPAVDRLESKINKLINEPFEDDLLVLFQEEAKKIKQQCQDLRSKLK